MASADRDRAVVIAFIAAAICQQSRAFLACSYGAPELAAIIRLQR